jgi:hypothetical protein
MSWKAQGVTNRMNEFSRQVLNSLHLFSSSMKQGSSRPLQYILNMLAVCLAEGTAPKTLSLLHNMNCVYYTHRASVVSDESLLSQ